MKLGVEDSRTLCRVRAVHAKQSCKFKSVRLAQQVSCVRRWFSTTGLPITMVQTKWRCVESVDVSPRLAVRNEGDGNKRERDRKRQREGFSSRVFRCAGKKGSYI